MYIISPSTESIQHLVSDFEDPSPLVNDPKDKDKKKKKKKEEEDDDDIKIVKEDDETKKKKKNEKNVPKKEDKVKDEEV